MNNTLVVTLFVITWSGMAFFGYVYVTSQPKYDIAPHYLTTAKTMSGHKDHRTSKYSDRELDAEVQPRRDRKTFRQKPGRENIDELVFREQAEVVAPKKTPYSRKTTRQSPQKTNTNQRTLRQKTKTTIEVSSRKNKKKPTTTRLAGNELEKNRKREALRKCKKEKTSKLNVTRPNEQEIDQYVTSQCSELERCQHTNLVGPLRVQLEQLEFDTLASGDLKFVKKGGWWIPHDCLEAQSVAIVIPFRNRYQHLPVLLRQLVPILYRQRLHHRIFVVEQDDTSDFNRGKLMNVGYAEALKQFPYTCFVFHDVDLIPENDHIDYGCTRSPMHLSVAIDKFNYRLPYTSIFGGIEMFSTQDYRTVNGFSNIFYSWGGEDDVLSSRLIHHKMKIHRQSVKTARYTMLRHDAKDKKRTQQLIRKTDLLMRTARSHPDADGLSSLQYRVKDVVEYQLYTLIKVDLQKEKENTFGIDLR